jgi:hypothetical protein
MNNLAYTSQDPAKVVASVEEMLRKELGTTEPIPYRIVPEGGVDTGVATFTIDAARFLFGGKLSVLFTLVFDIASPRPFELRAHVIRQGIGSHVGALLFSAPLQNQVAAESVLGDHKSFGSPKFTGDESTCLRLNAAKVGLTRSDGHSG